LGITDFDPLNGCSNEVRSAAKYVPLHLQGNAASAIAATAKGGFVRISVVAASCSE
jgi:hypothetical protein